MIKYLCTFMLCVTLAACSSEKKTETGVGTVLTGLVQARLAARKAKQQPPVAPAPITRASLVTTDKPLVIVSIARLGGATTLSEVARNGANRTYKSPQNQTVTFHHGIIRATRGLGVDLIGQGLSVPAVDLLKGPFPKTVTRTQQHLDGEGRLQTASYTCELKSDKREKIEILERSYNTVVINEICKNQVRGFANNYWKEAHSGIIWQSQQSVSKDIGHMTVQVLNP